MAVIKGLGTCPIQRDDGAPCGQQINEGEPIGTVIAGWASAPLVGHKRCADAYNARKQERDSAMKIGKQQGAGGSIGDPQSYPDALAFGSMPLEKTEPESEVQRPELNQVVMPEGVTPLSELPMDDEPAPAPEPERNIYRDGHNPPASTPSPPAWGQGPSADPRFETERDELMYLRGYEAAVRQERANRGEGR